MTESRAGALLCHPVFVLGLATLIVNDHYLKRVQPGWVTGKLSDFAGLIVAPIFIASVIEVAGSLTGRPTSRRRVTAVTALGVGLVFSLIQLVPTATQLYASIGGTTARLAFGALGQGAGGGPANVTADPTDLIALPALLAAVWIAARPGFALPRRGQIGNDLAQLR